jgi:uncharacterized coiled-coil protein SlyX
MTTPANADERLLAIEMIVSHIQHDLERLNQVVLEQQAALEQHHRELRRLEHLLRPIRDEQADMDGN